MADAAGVAVGFVFALAPILTGVAAAAAAAARAAAAFALAVFVEVGVVSLINELAWKYIDFRLCT